MKVSKERWTSWRKRNETRFASPLAYDPLNQSKLSCCLLSLDLLSRTFHKSRDFPALSACSIAFAPSRCSRFSRAFSRLHGFNFHSLVRRRVTCCCFFRSSLLWWVMFFTFQSLPQVTWNLLRVLTCVSQCLWYWLYCHWFIGCDATCRCHFSVQIYLVLVWLLL